MRIAVAGGTGTLGRHVVEAVRAAGHEPVVLARSTGVNLVGGTGAEEALSGADAAIDVVNIGTLSPKAATEFFTVATGNLLDAAARAGLANTVVLSIVGIDRNPNGYYAGKVAQERVVESSDAAWTILRATQFHEFAAQMITSAAIGPIHLAPRARVQPIAAREVAARLVELALGPAAGRAADLAGPREEELSDMIRAYAKATGVRPVFAANVPGAQMKGMRAGLSLPGPGAQLGVQTFAEWLEEQRSPA